MSPEARLYLAALVLFALFLWIGWIVARRPLGKLDTLAASFRSQATPLARAFTLSGRASGLAAASVAAFFVFLALHKPLWIPLAMIVSQLSSQGVVELFKAAFTRTRPDYWLVGLDAGHSYPSGHSATAVIFFIGWALVVAFSGLAPPIRDTLISVFALWALGIMWSRLALGAHYLSDVAGGAIFGAAWICGLCGIVVQFLGFLVNRHVW